MKYGKNDIESQTTVQGMSFRDYLRKREAIFNSPNYESPL